MSEPKRTLGTVLMDQIGEDCMCDLLDKPLSTYRYMQIMLDRTNQMFEYKGLPDTIPQELLELSLQYRGHACITKVDGNLYCLIGAPGGAPDPYYRPTLYVVANPALGYSASLSIKNHLPPFNKNQASQGECIFLKNDTNCQGLWYINSRYAVQLTENDISIRCAQINSRQQLFVSGQTDAEIESAQHYLDELVAGRFAAIGEKPFIEGIKPINIGTMSANGIIQLIELQQYLKASWFNEIGLNSNFNMKREYLSEEELRSSTDILLPFIDNMLICRKRDMEKVNELYGTNITVEKNSAWENKQKEVDTAQKQAESEVVEKGGDVVD